MLFLFNLIFRQDKPLNNKVNKKSLHIKIKIVNFLNVVHSILQYRTTFILLKYFFFDLEYILYQPTYH